MKGSVDFKTYGVTANGEEAEGNVVVAMPVGKPETPKATAKVEPPKEQPRQEQPKQQPPKPRRKMRF